MNGVKKAQPINWQPLSNSYFSKRMKEEDVQIIVAEGLDLMMGSPDNPKFFWCHVPNGEHRNIKTAAKLKRMGVKPGVWDILIWGPDGKTYYIEMKRPTETGRRNKPLESKLSDVQVTFRDVLIKLDIPEERFAIADGWCGVSDALKSWGLIP